MEKENAQFIGELTRKANEILTSSIIFPKKSRDDSISSMRMEKRRLENSFHIR